MSEIVAMYVELSKLPARVVAAFVEAGLEPPHRDTVDRIGYTARQRIIIGMLDHDSTFDL